MAQVINTMQYWEQTNPILELNTIAVVRETGQTKIGDGINHWSQLSFVQNATPTEIKIKDLQTGLYFRLDIRDNKIYFDKELTTLGFNGVESTDDGVTGDWVSLKFI